MAQQKLSVALGLLVFILCASSGHARRVLHDVDGGRDFAS
uniref:Uncharacterized protein n=1 Tax=Arundo donax TaxID=35708 RepID=A0A0A9A4X2_ARUDO